MTISSELKDIFTKNLRTSGIYIAFVLIVLLFTVLTNGLLLSPTNITNIVLQYSYVLVLALGMIIVIVGGHIDLSVGSLVALTGAVSAVLVIKGGMPWWVGMLAGILTGALCGVWQGFWVAIVGIPSFIVTLAGMLLFRGLTYEVLNNISLSPFPAGYQKIAGGFLNGLLGGYGFDTFTLVIGVIAVAGLVVSAWRTRQGRVKYGQQVESMAMFLGKNLLSAAIILWFFWQIATSRGMPIVLIILGVLIIAYHVLTTKTVFGRHVYAIGGNLSAAKLSGVNIKKINFWIFINMGMLAGVAGVVFSSRSNGAQPGAGNMFELDAIAACFIGGASTTGGVGRVTGAIVGGLVMAVLSNGMQLMGVGASAQQIVKGIVLLLAVAFDIYNKRRVGQGS
ncbi:multiple monosaccharide ABC transporter permease [Glutamicibacter soli]|uniref:Xylose transport system permease protein XylH n=1 Tax=Glutamicibacter soli TaxID=453836 RepID=A0A365YEK3_9MICC|nr:MULTISPECIES: multiple monosaccharide ABC transporter permease [Micrococcaceae]ALQ29267.1 ABC transporter permease [Arthrobacter sp. YC-RL1]KLI89336.1 ABC transporter permease [Arthrobacter sp. YC-RL1]RBM01126.1 sugar ABC transporter permease [Glutamicibacter soli]